MVFGDWKSFRDGYLSGLGDEISEVSNVFID